MTLVLASFHGRHLAVTADMLWSVPRRAHASSAAFRAVNFGLKLFVLSPHIVIGYSGDVDGAEATALASTALASGGPHAVIRSLCGADASSGATRSWLVAADEPQTLLVAHGTDAEVEDLTSERRAAIGQEAAIRAAFASLDSWLSSVPEDRESVEGRSYEAAIRAAGADDADVEAMWNGALNHSIRMDGAITAVTPSMDHASVGSFWVQAASSPDGISYCASACRFVLGPRAPEGLPDLLDPHAGRIDFQVIPVPGYPMGLRLAFPAGGPGLEFLPVDAWEPRRYQTGAEDVSK